jgi:hypothetical protein
MARIEARLNALGLVLPPAFTPPPGVVFPFVNVRVIGNRAVLAGHGPQSPEGPLAQPLGKVGSEVTVEQGYIAAKLTALSMLGYLKRALGDLDRISQWVRIFGMVNSAPGVCPAARGHQRLLRPHPRTLGPRGRRPCPQRGGDGRVAVRDAGGNRGRGSDLGLTAIRSAQFGLIV